MGYAMTAKPTSRQRFHLLVEFPAGIEVVALTLLDRRSALALARALYPGHAVAVVAIDD